MNTPHEQYLVKWFDDQLTAEELQQFEPLLAEHPEWIQEKAEYLQIKSQLQLHLPATEQPPLADLMRQQIQEAIAAETSKPKNLSFWRHLNQSKALIPLASAACLAIGWFAGSLQQTQTPVVDVPDPLRSEMVYTPDASIHARVLKRHEATVIVVDGLDAVPDQLELVQRQPQQAMWSNPLINPPRS